MLCYFAASAAVSVIEARSKSAVVSALGVAGYDWAQVDVDGLQVGLSGTAPNEATRFRALTIAGSQVAAERVIDRMEVAAGVKVAPPKFSIEILRNGRGISLIGLIPAATDQQSLITSITELAQGAPVTNMLDAADYPAPDNWPGALEFGFEALRLLPKSKISISADSVSVTAISQNKDEKRKLEAELASKAPEGLRLVLDISAPRPVITPFTLRFIIEDGQARFDACSADTEESRALIVKAAVAAGLVGKADCTIGLGVPTPKWGQAVVLGITAIGELGGGSITFSDADITLIAPDTTPQAEFDRVVGQMDSDLPNVFSLHAVKPEPVKIDGSGQGDGPPEFIATLSPEGQVQLRGRVTDDRLRAASETYARARFGLSNVSTATRVDADLPDGWPVRVLLSLEVLAELANGSVVVQPEFVDVRGVTGDSDASAYISRLMSEQLGAAENYSIHVAYEEKLDPAAGLPTPEECVASINAVLREQKITFAPSSADIDVDANGIIDRIADLLRDCPDVRMEIGGHTDSQGREVMNQELSQARADAVLTALMARRVLTSNLTAKGYGETVPIADNETEDGREANRRIEFTLIVPEPVVEEPTGLEAMETQAVQDPAPGETATEQAETTDEQN